LPAFAELGEGGSHDASRGAELFGQFALASDAFSGLDLVVD
jgi:hypothetical protein